MSGSYYDILFNEKVTSYGFFTDILPKINYYLLNKRSIPLRLSMIRTESVDPLVIPNMLSLGAYLKDILGGEPVELFIPWKPSLLSYLDAVGFLKIAKHNDLFKIDDEYIGGYTPVSLNCKTFCFDMGTSKWKIKDTIYDEVNNFLALSYHISNKLQQTFDLVDTSFIISQLIENSVQHSGSKLCFLTLQISRKIKKAYVSISDTGEGFYSSLSKKNEKEFSNDRPDSYNLFMMGKSNRDYRNYFSILSAIMHRKDDQDYGIFHLCKILVKLEDAKIRIHSLDTQNLITNYMCKQYYEANGYDKRHELTKEDLYNMLMENFIISPNINNNFSRIRRAYFPGVHIECEYPYEEVL